MSAQNKLALAKLQLELSGLWGLVISQQSDIEALEGNVDRLQGTVDNLTAGLMALEDLNPATPKWPWTWVN